jgi:pSer/pThr/pTyr-binding forkhead associated (FHA) protein
MTRARASTVVALPVAGASTDAAAMPSTSSTAQGGKESHPTIRFIPHVETRSTRPSLHFQAVSRTLKNASTIVRVGRYSERDSPTAEDNMLPVGFKSKVVSRRHCEFWCASGQWYVKDVKSSSGTFLNHVRLSSPGVESRPYPVNDGDVVQLGIDFKGGEEVIFRCVKIRVECNRGWQKSLNNFNSTTHKRLLRTAGVNKSRDSDAASVNTSECSICLNPVAPCQALFVAPCSHVWHYKCVRNLIHGPNWPNFLCPNCRFVADLEADVEPPEEEEEEFEEIADFQDAEEGLDPDQSGETGVSSDDAVGSLNGNGGDAGNLTDDSTTAPRTPSRLRDTLFVPLDNSDRTANITDEELAGLVDTVTFETPTRTPAVQATSSSAVTSPVAISSMNGSKTRSPPPPDLMGTATPRSTAPFALGANIISEGPMTPRNNAGPYVLDGRAGREMPVMESLAGTVMSDQDELELARARSTS